MAAAAPPRAAATTGGPDVTTLLGYQTRTGKIYYEVTSFSEGPGTLVYSIAVDSIGRSLPNAYPIPSMPPNDFKAHEQWTQSTIDSLRSSLVQPDTLPRARARVASRILGTRLYSASDDYTRRPQFSIQVDLSVLALSGHAVINTFCTPDLRLAEIFLVPGGTRAIARVVYTGLPYESCYDADTFVLLTLKKLSAR